MTITYKLKNYNNNEIYIKREDLLPFSFGGNKARKAEKFFEEIIKGEYNYIVTYGSSSSNHCRIIANKAIALNIPCIIISPNNNENKYNKQLVKLFEGKIVNCEISEVKETIEYEMEEARRLGYKPYFIEGGGHGDLGTEAYVEAYNEILQYENNNNIEFDYIFHASGTGTTQAGLICGNIINRKNKDIIGISIARKKEQGSNVILESVNSYLKKIDQQVIDKEEIHFIDDYISDGYGKYNFEIIETIKYIMKKYGIPRDSTYVGKAFWGIQEYIDKENIKNKNILFIHTGGSPLFFDDLKIQN